MADEGHGGEEVHRFIDLHLQDLANAFATPSHRQSFGVETCAPAHLAQHFDIGQKTHLNRTQTLTFATRASAFAGIEAEAPWPIASCFGFQGFGKQLTYGVPKTNVGGRATARCFTNRGLIDFQHPLNAFITRQTHTALPHRQLTRIMGFAACLGRAQTHHRLHIGEQHITRQGGFTRTTDTRHRDQAMQRKCSRQGSQVVQICTHHLQTFCFTLAALIQGDATPHLQWVLHGVA